jgi:hypothetical protein
MRLIDGIKLKGRPAEIPNCSRNDLPEFFKELGFRVGAEIGVYKGEYSEVVAKSGLKLYSIDSWNNNKNYNYGEDEDQKWFDSLCQESHKRLDKFPNVTIIRKTSMEALEDFEDESLDFVYIDANHRFKYIAEDIMGWERKVKTGGVIVGHDYAYFNHAYPGGGIQVREIVDAFAQSFNFNFWVLCKYRDKPRDRYRSWMFIKNWRNR